MIRFLAHGGTAYVPRGALGAWPAAPHPDVLQDSYGLSADSASFGIGLAGPSPYLILRELQRAGERNYPYTFLLDPGEDLWERWGWNAALLASILCSTERQPGSVAYRLWFEPASLVQDSSGLEEWIASARTALPQTAVDDDLNLPWFASLAGQKPLWVTPQECGFKSRPTAAEVAAVLSALPPSLRVARGWLVGGGPAHAVSYGANLVVDDTRNANDSENARRVESGTRVRRCWGLLASGNLSGEAAPFMRAKPGSEFATLAANELETLSLAVEAASGAPVAEALFQALSSSQFSTLLWKAMGLAFEDGGEGLSPGSTSIVIEFAAEKRLRIPGGLSRALDPAACAATLRKLGFPKSDFTFLGLSPDAKLQHWKAELARRTKEAPAVLREALAEKMWTELEQADLIGAAAGRIDPAADLSAWAAHRNNPQVGERLRAEAFARLRQQRPVTWAEDFLSFGRPADLLPHLETMEPQPATHLAKVALSPKWRTDSNAAAILESYGNSIVMTRLEVQLKRDIAKSKPSGKETSYWADYLKLDRILSGEDPGGAPIADPERANWLKSDLRQLVEDMKRLNARNIPDLTALFRWLGKPDPQTAQALLELKPSLADHGASARWTEGWYAAGLIRESHKERLRAALERSEGEKIRIGNGCDEVGADSVREWFFKVLFERRGGSDTNDAEAETAAEVIRVNSGNNEAEPVLQSVISKALKEQESIPADRQEPTYFFRTMRRVAALRNSIFAALANKKELSQKLARFTLADPGMFVKMIQKRLPTSDQVKAGTFEFAILSYALSDSEDAARMRRRYNRSIYTLQSDAPHEDLRKLLPASAEEAAETVRAAINGGGVTAGPEQEGR